MTKNLPDPHKILKGKKNLKEIAQKLGGITLVEEEGTVRAKFNYAVTNTYDKNELKGKNNIARLAVDALFDSLKKTGAIIVTPKQGPETQYAVISNTRESVGGKIVTDTNIYLKPFTAP